MPQVSEIWGASHSLVYQQANEMGRSGMSSALEEHEVKQSWRYARPTTATKNGRAGVQAGVLEGETKLALPGSIPCQVHIRPEMYPLFGPERGDKANAAQRDMRITVSRS